MENKIKSELEADCFQALKGLYIAVDADVTHDEFVKVKTYIAFLETSLEESRKELNAAKVHCSDANKGARINSMVNTSLAKQVLELKEIIKDIHTKLNPLIKS